MTNENLTQPELSADFALRVLAQSDRVLAHRRRIRRAFAAGTVSVSIAFAAVVGLRVLDRGAPTPLSPAVVALADSQPPAPDSGAQADALDDLFPDAAPVERFDRTYLSDGSPADNLLAEDTADDDGGP
jgi:hypothetical protein